MGIWKDKFGYVAEENETLRAEIARLNSSRLGPDSRTWKNAYVELGKLTYKLKADNEEIMKQLEKVTAERDYLQPVNYAFSRVFNDIRSELKEYGEVVIRLRKLLEVKTKEIHFLREKYKESTQDNEEANDGTD